jgi:hypothetical protein
VNNKQYFFAEGDLSAALTGPFISTTNFDKGGIG